MFATKAKAASLIGREVDVSGWLGLAAAPTFAVLGALSAASAPGMMICSATSPLPINDMALMYLLMGLFHLSPWLKLGSALSQRRSVPAAKTEGD